MVHVLKIAIVFDTQYLAAANVLESRLGGNNLNTDINMHAYACTLNLHNRKKTAKHIVY